MPTYNMISSQTQEVIISTGNEKAGDFVVTETSKPCIPANAVVILNPPVAQGQTYIQGKAPALLYIAPPKPDNVQVDDRLVWSDTPYNWNAAPLGGTYRFWTLNPSTNGYYIYDNKDIKDFVQVAPGTNLTEFMPYWSLASA